jgi:hypothetical protein
MDFSYVETRILSKCMDKVQLSISA